MTGTAFIFPGQGAQYAGMGRDFYEQENKSRQVFELASDTCGIDIKKLCFEDNERLHQTEYTQTAMLTTTMAITEVLKEKGLIPDVNAGLSLGEYNALGSSGVMGQEDLFRLVRKRGMLMQHAVPEGGAMAAVIGTDTELIEKVCQSTQGIVSIANYNCPGQIVITGETTAVEAAAAALKEQGARRIIPLKVSGPFHSAMLKEAAEEFAEALEPVELHSFETPYVTNVYAGYVRQTDAVKELLVQQMYSPVKWQQCVEAMIMEGVHTFVEVGPGRTLSGFMRKINRNVTCINIEKTEDLQKAEAILQGGN